MANIRGHRRTLSQGIETSLPPQNSQQQGAPPPPHNAQTQGGDPSVSPNQQMGNQPIPPPPNIGSGSLPADQAGTSRQPPRTVPWEEYEALRQQHVEGVQALRDMAGQQVAPPPPHNAQTQGGDRSVSPNQQMGNQPIPPPPNIGSGSLPADQAGTSRQPPRTVPWEEYEALRQQHVEGVQALRDMAGVLQSMMLGGTLPGTLKKFMPQPEVGADSYQEATPDSHSRSTPRREDRPKSPPPRRNPHSVPQRNENPRMENKTRSPQRRRSKIMSLEDEKIDRKSGGDQIRDVKREKGIRERIHL
ncbi:uncharacterized protein LOC127787565 [Diospyros lotus]|uniref:uncharacterized protein LOC127787565 n=1 Tax=Diospyros lotus TaxID=55363 RepID=UPI002252205C|nr:uncharacterized protein LOC127787565 [Diospyros lotus]